MGSRQLGSRQMVAARADSIRPDLVVGDLAGSSIAVLYIFGNFVAGKSDNETKDSRECLKRLVMSYVHRLAIFKMLLQEVL